jgi:hypothetical protein
MREIVVWILLGAAVAAFGAWCMSQLALRRRRHGKVVEVCLVLLGLIQEVQLHRGLSGALLDGRKRFRTDLEDNEYKLQRSLHMLAEQYGSAHPVFRSDQWRIVLGRWESLRNHWRELPFDTNIAAHGEVINGLAGILGSIGRKHRNGLGERQSRIVSHWPELIEDLGLLRALGLHILGHRATAADQLLVDTIARQINASRGHLKRLTDTEKEQALVVRTGRALRRVSWLIEGNAERYHPYTFYEEMTGVIDDWHAAIRRNLLSSATRMSLARRVGAWLRPTPETG